MSLDVSISPALLIAGIICGALVGPAAASLTATVPVQSSPWRSDSRRRLLGAPAPLRRRVYMSFSCAVVLGGLVTGIGWRPALLAFLAMGVVGVALAVIDWEHHRLPDRITFPAGLVSLAVLLVDAGLTGSWSSLLRGLVCAGVAGALLALMALISPAGMGLGDVKLAALLSLHTGWIGWQVAILAVLGGFVAGSVVALTLVAMRRVTLRTAVPFGPALLLGAWLAVLVFAPLG